MWMMTTLNNVAFIIGNGRTREGFDLNLLVGHGTIYGCNALYRDFKPPYIVPDFLVSIDDPIIAEIEKSDFPQDRFIVPPKDEQYEPAEFNPGQPRSNAGMNAMMEAIKADHDVLYCFGFDFLLKSEVCLDNLYKDTNAYGPDTATSYADSFRRVRYFEWFANKHPDVSFKMVFPNGKDPFHSMKTKNVIGINFGIIEDKIHTLNAK